MNIQDKIKERRKLIKELDKQILLLGDKKKKLSREKHKHRNYITIMEGKIEGKYLYYQKKK